MAVPSTAGRLSAEDRTALAEELGYRSIGADLPDNVTLTQVISSLPKEVRAFGLQLTSAYKCCCSQALLPSTAPIEIWCLNL
jgi:hypothetical protein